MSTQDNRPTDWHTLSGEIPFRMTNDYLFRALMQTDNQVLIALIADFLGWDHAAITSATIENPIELGQAMDAKTFILDVCVKINNRIVTNLEMQVLDEHNWPERSLVYLCRTFDSINRNQDYQELKPAYHIGITDFKLFADHPEFYATYKLLNTKDSHEYTDKFRLSVLCLPYVGLATEADKEAHLHEWAAMYSAKNWEDLIMIAKTNPDIDKAVTTMYTISQNDLVYQQMLAREEYYRLQRSMKHLLEDTQKQRDSAVQDLATAMQERDSAVQERDSAVQQLDSAVQERDEAIQALDAKEKEIAELKAQLAAQQ